MEEYINTNFDIIKIIRDSLEWYNLSTNRIIKNVEKLIYLDYPKIASKNKELIIDFIFLNKLEINSIIIPDKYRNIIINNIKLRYNIKPLKIKKYKNISKVPDEILKKLKILSFSPSGIFTMTKVVNVIDGDTIDICTLISLNELATQYFSKDGKNMQSSIAYFAFLNPKILIKVRCRLYGIDAAEKNTIEGKIIKKFSKNLYEKSNNIVYCYFLKSDKFGRVLVNIYQDEEKKHKINTMLLNHKDEKYGKLVVEYDGKTKNKEFHDNTSSTNNNITDMEENIIDNEEFYFTKKSSCSIL